jgi:tRNA(Ile)-lysidine synthase
VAVRAELANIRGGKVLVAVSGGPDSTALLDALMSVAPELVCGAHHVNHMLRPEATAELCVAQSLAERLGVPFTSSLVDTRAYMARHALSLETAARELRYRALRAAAARVGATVIALGHTADDQVETVLMHEFRGSGISGLAGMRTLNGDLFRPLLRVRHRAVEQYCEARDLVAVDDTSNVDRAMLRNRVRHDMLPVIEATFPGARAAVLRLADSAHRDSTYLIEMVDEAMTQIASCGEVLPELLAALPASIRGHLVVRAGRRGVAIGMERPSPARPLCLGEMPVEMVQLVLPGVSEVGGLRFESAVGRVNQSTALEARLRHAWTVHLDAVRLSTLQVRAWRHGDAISLPSGGHKKLHDVFIDAHVPVSQRYHIPVLESRGEIVWVVGLAQGRTARMSSETRTRLVVRVRPTSIECGYGST